MPNGDLGVRRLTALDALEEVAYVRRIGVGFVLGVVLDQLPLVVEKLVAPLLVPPADLNHAGAAVHFTPVLLIRHAVWIPDPHFPDQDFVREIEGDIHRYPEYADRRRRRACGPCLQSRSAS